MTRISDIPFDTLTPEQRRIATEISSARGSSQPRGPFPIWLRAPGLAESANRLGNVLRVHGKLDKRLFELAVLLIARHWSASYEWYAHEDDAFAAGLSPEVVRAIRVKQFPDFKRDDERLVYEIIAELNDTNKLNQSTYDRAIIKLGLDPLVELIAVAGFYTMVAMTLNAFDVSVPEGNSRPFDD
ncbi:MAG: carboxymuconolactone decarboxylase family protein [Nitrososphaerales archaeon]